MVAVEKLEMLMMAKLNIDHLKNEGNVYKGLIK
jgi:hypothetical protein